MRERELAKFDCKSASIKETEKAGMLNPMREKREGYVLGGGGETPVNTACPEGGRG